MITQETRRIGVLTSGGDAPGMNAAIRAVTGGPPRIHDRIIASQLGAAAAEHAVAGEFGKYLCIFRALRISHRWRRGKTIFPGAGGRAVMKMRPRLLNW